MDYITAHITYVCSFLSVSITFVMKVSFLLGLKYYWFVSFLFAILVCDTSQGDIGFFTMALAEAVAERCGFWLRVAAQAAVFPLCRRQISRVTQEKHIV